MQIEKKWIKNLSNYLAAIPEGASFRVIKPVDDKKLLSRIGLDEGAGVGETILPRIVGPTSRFNAEGKWVALKALPKETRYIRTVRWAWTTWDGEKHEDFRDIYRECYQRAHIAPPSVELTFVERGDKSLIVVPVLKNDPADAEKAIHVINLFLELFGSCEIVQANLERMNPPVLKKANWKLLPSGQYPWERIREHVENSVRHMSEGTCSVILDRQRALENLGPDERWVGEGGFNDYMAYVFRSFGIVVLESLRKDNAIYVFKGEWRHVSRLTKAEIIQNKLHYARIVHAQSWKEKLAQLFIKKAA